VWSRFGPLHPAKNIRKPLGWSNYQISFAAFNEAHDVPLYKKIYKANKTDRLCKNWRNQNFEYRQPISQQVGNDRNK
jgi:hypothetical protein